MDEFIEWLKTDLTHFVALIEEGSVVAGDPWQEGYSDHDMNLIVSADKQNEIEAVYGWLDQHKVGDTYLFAPRLLDEFLTGDSLNDVSLKFRARTVAGRDVVAEKKLPDREIARQIGRDGLLDTMTRFERRWLNLANWSLDYARKKNYEIFKNFFVFYATWQYGTGGEYPVNRAAAAALISDSKTAAALLKATNDIGNSSKEDQKLAFEGGLKLIPELISSAEA